MVVQADGGSRGNPGPAGYGAVVLDAGTGEVLAERKAAIGTATNNVAEYHGLIAGLAAAAELGATDVRVELDSKLVIEQMSGRWQVKHESMRPLHRQAGELAAGFDEVGYQWIPRERNRHADRLANEAMDAGATGSAARSGRASSAGTGSSTAGPAESAEQQKLPPGAWVLPQSTPTRLLLVRHGVTAYSVERRFAGRSDLELTPDGLEQARLVAGRIAELGPVDAVVSSPLRRARQTAQQIADRLGLDVAVEEGMVETDFGDWDGYTYAEVSRRWPDELARWLADPAVAPPSGESFETVTRRVRRARDRILARHAGQTVAVVSHVTPIKTLVRLALDAPPAALHQMFLAPASVCAVNYYADGPVSLQSFNDTAHLGSLRQG
ncbi:MAG: bifunctional RNase H/acid phosphatase [Actinobacteria bacterium]|nr:bifunctional RNase H/acid phosphatase [Actinomycetota bacterium]